MFFWGGKKMSNKIWKKGLVLGIITLFIGVGVVQSTESIVFDYYSQPDTVYVDDDFNSSTPGWEYDHFDNIRNGIMAVANQGTVIVYNGIYYESFDTHTKSIHLIGEDKESTIIDCSGLNNHAIRIHTSGFTIQGFTLTYAGGNPYLPSGIVLSPDLSSISISDCIFTNMDHGIYFENVSNLDIRKCHFHHNDDSSIFGIEPGIISEYNENITITDCIFNNNGKELGGGYYQTGGISMHSCSNTEIANCTIYDNIGMGIQITNTLNVTINNNNIYGNSVVGIRLADDNINLEIYKNTIYNNTLFGVILEEGHFSNSNVHNNNISYNGNRLDKENDLIPTGGLWIDVVANGGLIIKQNKIANNDIYGIILAYECSSVKINQNNFFNNNESDAYFRYYDKFLPGNRWSNNYWSKPKFLPKLIIGDVYITGLNILVPWFNIDWRPALKPHDI